MDQNNWVVYASASILRTTEGLAYTSRPNFSPWCSEVGIRLADRKSDLWVPLHISERQMIAC